MTKRKGLRKKEIWITKEEDELLKDKKFKTLREHLLSDVGISVSPRPRGRKSDATKALEAQYEQFQADAREKVHDELVASTLDAETSIRMYGDKSPHNKVVCSNCTLVYYTTSKTESKCWRCGYMNRTPRKPVPLEVQGEQPATPEEKTVAPNTEGNLGGAELPDWTGKSKVGSERIRDALNPGVVSVDLSRFKFPRRKKK